MFFVSRHESVYRADHAEADLILEVPLAHSVLDRPPVPASSRHCDNPIARLEFLGELPKKHYWSGAPLYGLHELYDCSVSYFTFMADPVHRVLWELENELSLRGSQAAENVDLMQTTAIEFINSARNLNIQSHQLARLSQERPGFRNASIFSDTLEAADWSEDLEQAKDRVEALFAFVGVFERSAESLFLLFDSYGWEWLPYLGIRGIGPSVLNNLPQETLDKVKELTAGDQMLYAWVNSRLDNLLETTDYGTELAQYLEVSGSSTGDALTRDDLDSFVQVIEAVDRILGAREKVNARAKQSYLAALRQFADNLSAQLDHD